MDWLKRKPSKQLADGAQAGPVAAQDLYAPLRELIFADESLEGVARFVLQEEASGTQARPLWTRLAKVAAQVAQGQRRPAIEELYRLLDDEGEDARSCFQFWNYLRQLDEQPGPAVATRVLGLVIEHARQGGPEILSAYWDGTARMLPASGDFRMYTEPAPFMVAEVRRWLRVCKPLAEGVEPLKGPRPPPPSGSRGRITVLTPGGLRTREAEWDALWEDALCGPVLEMAGALSERLVAVLEQNGTWRSGVAPWPRRGGQYAGGSQVH
ncbi:hypothetical protein [Pyxidicoccus sp. MSG2]|uniref:hypothetical protein n=1 Tax=Pyxidicoccus sp. MSG2 TaxID=2996790 RepID=UPI00226DBBBD|nr:hypothetical protein [Pyxidicoccus sp. MSG2]MCY1018422.1 hypothetical protein [Pyxidicoccus sp. MSG2]